MSQLHFGFAQVRDPETVPEGCFLCVAPENGGLDHLNAETVGNRPIFLLLMPLPGDETDEGLRLHFKFMAGWMATRNLSPMAVGYGEEWYNGSQTIEQKDAIKARVDHALTLVKEYWPGAYTVQIEPWFNDWLELGPAYYHPPFACDVLAIDMYLWPEGSEMFHTLGMPLTPDAPYAKFYLEVGRLVEWALARFPQPVMLFPQAAYGPDPGAFWSRMPTPPQLRWWYELALTHDRIIALCFYARQSLHPGISALDQHPEHWAEVLREIAQGRA